MWQLVFRINVSTSMKVVAYLVSLVPGLASLAVLAQQYSQPDGNRQLAVFCCALFLAVSCWLFSRMYFLCSIVLSESGLEQSFVSARSGFRRHVRLSWDQIATVCSLEFRTTFRVAA